jgi:hypothetical protein
VRSYTYTYAHGTQNLSIRNAEITTVKCLKLSELYIRMYMLKKYERIINDSTFVSLLDDYKLSHYRLLRKNVFLSNSVYNIYTLSYFTFYSTIDQASFFNFDKCYNSLFK